MVTTDANVVFQSTPPRREVTGGERHGVVVGGISIHTSPKGGDLGHGGPGNGPTLFQSTPPRREVTSPSA